MNILGVSDFFFLSLDRRFLALNGIVFAIFLMSKDAFSGTSLKFKDRRGYRWVFIYFRGIERLYTV